MVNNISSLNPIVYQTIEAIEAPPVSSPATVCHPPSMTNDSIVYASHVLRNLSDQERIEIALRALFQ